MCPLLDAAQNTRCTSLYLHLGKHRTRIELSSSCSMKTPPIQSVVLDSLSSLWTQLRASVVLPIVDEAAEAHKQLIDPNFERWLHGDPLVMRNPASRYAERSPGYMTGNGLGSLEIGAADD